jgi:hypothetical protein
MITVANVVFGAEPSISDDTYYLQGFSGGEEYIVDLMQDQF